MSWARKLIWLRRRLDIQQQQLAAILNVSKSAVSRWESGDLIPDGGNQALIETLYLQAQKKEKDQLRSIGSDVLECLAVGTAIAGLILLMGALFKD
jgi:transcriptional regulator with XRE-family HTH domain